MENPALETIFLPFENGLIPWPRRALFIGARGHGALKRMGAVDGIQYFKPFANTLPPHLTSPQRGEGYERLAHGAYPALGGGDYDVALCLIPKDAVEARGMLAQGALNLKTGGYLLAAAPNDAGGGRIDGWMGEAGFLTQSLSKHKSRVVWAAKSAWNDVLLRAWADAGSPRTLELDGEMYATQPGLFGWDKVDAGSKLLAVHFPDDIRGTVADFGCGYGYLSRQVMAKNPAIEKIYVIDADLRAVDCGVKNTGGEGIWADLTNPVPGLPLLDVIIMNPPFHEGKGADAAIGQGFIRTACVHLKQGGNLWMVANAHLPYEALLKTQFQSVIKITEQHGFKVFHATK